MSTNTDKRKHVRRALTYPGMIDTGGDSPMLSCTLHDASEEGAKLYVTAAQDLPNEFTLVLGYDGTATRRCRVKWRSDAQVGVEFLRDPKSLKASSAVSIAALTGLPPEPA